MQVSCFLCLSLPPEAAPNLQSSFDSIIRLSEARSWPIGSVTRGKNEHWPAYLLQVGFGSAQLVGPFPRRRTHNNDRSGFFIAGLQGLLAAPDCRTVRFLFHWFSGYLHTETIALKDERTVRLAELAQTVHVLVEDVRYIVHEGEERGEAG